MVEYAMLLAGTSLGSLSAAASSFMADLDWKKVSYVALALLAVRIATWAFRIRV